MAEESYCMAMEGQICTSTKLTAPSKGFINANTAPITLRTIRRLLNESRQLFYEG